MKKLLLTCSLFVGVLGAKAYDLPYLLFQTTDGSITALRVDALSMTTAEGKLTATNSSGSRSFVLTHLTKMVFSADGVTAINRVLPADGVAVEVYSFSGIVVGKYRDFHTALQSLQPGTYVVKAGRQTQKISIQ